MEVFQDLMISSDGANGLPDAVAAAPLPSWSRNGEAEGRAGRLQPGTGHMAFLREQGRGLPGAGLSLMRDDGGWTVTNIVPLEGTSLSTGTYNRLLQEFHDELVPLAMQLGLSLRTSKADMGVVDYLPGQPGELLRAFSDLANKNTGASHPKDFERWAAFLVSAHRRRVKLDHATLERLLVEELGWSPDVADGLGSDYSFARQLLRSYDGA